MTNERWYGELEIRVRTLEREVENLRKWRHDVPSELIGPIQNQIQDVMEAVREIPAAVRLRHPRAESSGENRAITMRDIYMFSAGLGAFYAVGKLLHWFS